MQWKNKSYYSLIVKGFHVNNKRKIINLFFNLPLLFAPSHGILYSRVRNKENNMTQYRFYIGTKAGKNWEHSFWKDKVFTHEEVEENIETVRELYNLSVVEKIVEGEIAETVDAYTLFDGIGFWQGVKEHTIVLEILISNMNAEWFAEALTSYCKQDCVLFTSQRVDCDCR